MFSFLHKSSSSGTAQKTPPNKFDEEATNEPTLDQQREDLRQKIISLWKTVWDGLYQTHSGKGSYRISELQTLCAGAGMSSYDGKSCPLSALDSALSTSYSWHHGRSSGGLENLKLYDELSLETLNSVLEVLKAFEKEIEPLREVYAVLRSLQVGLREPTEDDQQKVMKEVRPLAEPLGKRLKHYHARLGVLGMDMWDEAVRVKEERGKEEGRSGEVKVQDVRGTRVKEMVYPRGKKGFGSFVGSGSGSGW